MPRQTTRPHAGAPAFSPISAAHGRRHSLKASFSARPTVVLTLFHALPRPEQTAACLSVQESARRLLDSQRWQVLAANAAPTGGAVLSRASTGASRPKPRDSRPRPRCLKEQLDGEPRL